MNIRTLIVDDQLIAREMLRRMLKDEADIEIVGMPATGREALEAIKRFSPDLVFLDVHMPDLDGFGVLAELPENQAPVIITAIPAFSISSWPGRIGMSIVWS